MIDHPENLNIMKKRFFTMLNQLNKAVLPRLSKKDPAKLKRWEMGILAYRYYVLINSLD